jgi:DNA repair protein RecO (recombination protein O)
MRSVTTEAIILRTYNLAEADRIVVCLTKSSGLVRGVAKGARRMKSRFGAALEPFTRVRLSFNEKENRDLVSLSNAEILKSSFELNSRLEAAEVLAYIGELVTEFAPPHEADERLFRMITACVDALMAEAGTLRPITRYFEIWLLRLAGLFPDLQTCSNCGAAVGEADIAFADTELRIRCAKCRIGAGAILSLPIMSAIRASQKLSPLRFAENYRLSDTMDAELGDITHRLITRAIDRRPRTQFASAR